MNTVPQVQPKAAPSAKPSRVSSNVRLKLASSDLSPEKALAQLRRIQRHRVSINQAAPISGISTINTQQAGVLAALNLKKPTEQAQPSLL